ncbi:hypothetical protein FB446DRAFT_488461 [Lentinula raphanica]|nr:hypothetical protein FB446DRAFT_488461 [Lentinula raphanica]
MVFGFGGSDSPSQSSSSPQPFPPYQTYSRKRTNDVETEDSSDATTPDPTSTPYDKKDKYRAVAGPEQMKFDQMMREVQELKKTNMFLTSKVTEAERKAEEFRLSADEFREAAEEARSSAEEAFVTVSMMDGQITELRNQIAASEMDVDKSVQIDQPDMARRTGEPEDASIAVLESQANQQQQSPQLDAERIAQIIKEKEEALQNALMENQWFRQQIDETVCTLILIFVVLAEFVS